MHILFLIFGILIILISLISPINFIWGLILGCIFIAMGLFIWKKKDK